MIRFLLRFIGLILLATGFIFFVYDGAKSLADNVIRVTTVDQLWSNVHQDSLGWLKAWLTRNGADWLWDTGIRAVIDRPTWLVLAVLGALLMILGRKKKPLIGYARD